MDVCYKGRFGISIFPRHAMPRSINRFVNSVTMKVTVSPLIFNILMSFHRHNLDLLLIDSGTMGKYCQTHAATSECDNICTNQRWRGREIRGANVMRSVLVGFAPGGPFK